MSKWSNSTVGSYFSYLKITIWYVLNIKLKGQIKPTSSEAIPCRCILHRGYHKVGCDSLCTKYGNMRYVYAG